MKLRVRCLVMAMGVLLAGVALAQDENIPLKNWTAPPYWTPPRAAEQGVPEGRMEVSAEGMNASAQALPSSPVPFVAIAPCRIVDTRVGTSDGFHEPNFADGETRTFDIPASTDCPGLPATSVAYSFNVQYRPLSVLAFITLFPTGTTLPAVSTLTASPAAWVEDAAIVPAGTSGQVDVYCQYAGRVVIDVNGYYAAQSLVSSLNTKTGDLTLAAGSNVTITPSANTLTIAATGGPGGDLPTGSATQTLRNTGSAWIASSALTNDGSNVGISGDLFLPSSTGATGVIELGGVPFLHDYAGPGTGGQNTFLGQNAGNFSMGGSDFQFQGSYNVGVGAQTLASNTTGHYNTASGVYSLYFNTTGSANTADGDGSLGLNTTGSYNTASGYGSLFSNTTADDNTASGYDSLQSNTTGFENTASGFGSLYANTTGSYNTASGSGSLESNTTGLSNTASGYNSLYSNTTGSYNTASGYGSLYSNTTGYQNTASGSGSLYANTTGSNNTSSGFGSLEYDTTGSSNTASGGYSLYANTTGSGNTADGDASLELNTTGFHNTALGAIAGGDQETITAYGGGTATIVSNTTGAYNTFVGYGTGATTSDVENCTAVGNNAYCSDWNQVRLGNALVNSIGGKVAWSALSDARAKTDIRNLDLGLDFVMKLRPVAYRLRNGNDKTDMGFVAQDIEATLGDGYNALDIGGDPARTLSLRYTELIAPLVKAVQEQQAEISTLRKQLADRDALQTRIDAQQAEIEAFKAQSSEIDELRRQVQTLMATRETTKSAESIGN